MSSRVFFDSKLPEVKLVGAINDPYDLSVATARTCYSSKGIISVEEVSQDEKSKMLRDRIAASTLEAGHLTTRQHAHFVFAMSHVSRSFIWSFLHSHPFYNSEQVSQRYVKVKEGHMTIPKLTGSARELYQKILNLQMSAYLQLIERLQPVVREEYFKIFKNRKWEKRWLSVVEKKTYEIARYVLPIATHAYLYHTVSALTLLRYAKMCEMGDVPTEQRYVVGRMVAEVLKHDPEFEKELREPIEATEEFSWLSMAAPSASENQFVKEFDEVLKGKVSALIDSSSQAEKTLAHAVRTVLAQPKQVLPDEAAIELVLNPHKNKILSNTLNVMTFSKITRALHSVHFTFQKKLSHTADSQDQRHRMTPAARPLLSLHYRGIPDVMTPKLMTMVPKAHSLYEDVVDQTVQGINTLLKEGVSFEKAHYLLPNAWAIRLVESGDLLNWHHKWKLRTCYTAQDEIFYASVQELLEVERRFPLISKYIQAPCFVRKLAQVKPYCPEGDRFCGVPVWNLPITAYERII
ncbi:MAG: FAD-dependent thymidylate synthase [Deltaproteobacteria bacterium]|nr:FAD-dependent thymidylate synthase [Deltaproteobacteria bacterium]